MNKSSEQKNTSNEILQYIKKFFATRKVLVLAIMFSFTCLSFIVTVIFTTSEFLIITKPDFKGISSAISLLYFFIIIIPAIYLLPLSIGLCIIYKYSKSENKNPKSGIVWMFSSLLVFSISILTFLILILTIDFNILVFFFNFIILIPIIIWIVFGFIVLFSFNRHLLLKSFSCKLFKVFSIISIIFSVIIILISILFILLIIYLPLGISLMLLSAIIWEYSNYITSNTAINAIEIKNHNSKK